MLYVLRLIMQISDTFMFRRSVSSLLVLTISYFLDREHNFKLPCRLHVSNCQHMQKFHKSVCSCNFNPSPHSQYSVPTVFGSQSPTQNEV